MACVDYLKDNNKVRSVRQFALSVDYHPQNLNDIMKGKRDATIELIKTATELYKINPNYLFTGLGPMFAEGEIPRRQSDNLSNQDVNRNILYVPMTTRSNYAEHCDSRDFLDSLSGFSLPGYKTEGDDYRCFEVFSDCMEPSLFVGDKIVCSPVDIDNLSGSIKNNLVYVLVLENSIVIKRVVNHIYKDGTLELVSDHNFYKPYYIKHESIKEVWHIDMKWSHFLPSPNNIRNSFHEEMDVLRRTIDVQSKSIQSLNLSVEKLLKQSRSLY